MKKKVAKVFKKYGEKKVKMIKNYSPKSKRPVTTAITGTRKELYQSIGNILLNAKREEQELIAKTLKGDFFEDWDFENKLVIKY